MLVDKEGKCFKHDVYADDSGDGDEDFDPPLQDTLATLHGCESRQGLLRDINKE